MASVNIPGARQDASDSMALDRERLRNFRPGLLQLTWENRFEPRQSTSPGTVFSTCTGPRAWLVEQNADLISLQEVGPKLRQLLPPGWHIFCHGELAQEALARPCVALRRESRPPLYATIKARRHSPAAIEGSQTRVAKKPGCAGREHGLR